MEKEKNLKLLNEIEKEFNIPSSKEERFKVLKEASKKLKEKFVGIDDNIDEIIKSITPWYITPEIIERPTIISLWGMTGTGKTSVVKELLNLLSLSPKSFFLDCGSEDGESSTSTDSFISEFVEKSKDDSPIFIFDEFQYARTIDDWGVELSKPKLRPIWNLMDDGMLNIDDVYNYDLQDLISYLDRLIKFCKSNPNIKLKNRKITEQSDLDIFKSSILYKIYYTDFDGYGDGPVDISYDSKKKKDSKKPMPYDLFSSGRWYRLIISRLEKQQIEESKISSILDELDSKTTTGDAISTLITIKNIVSKVKMANCSKSLIFIIGNLDEAYGSIVSDVSPDMDADTVYEITSQVTVNDIKESLRKRFRPEQIARFGNNIIKYNTLKKDSFIYIIKKELENLTNKFKENHGINISINESIINLIYSEGVFPAQGTRPVFTTINNIFTPLLSEIEINKEKEDKNITIYTEDSDFKKQNIDIKIKFNESKEIIKNISLVLGSLRDPSKRKTRYINSVHEIGHAIVMSYRTGILPKLIVSVSVDNGGFCITYDKDKNNKIESVRDIDDEVMISLGGYLAERIIYNEDLDMTLLGSNSDIRNAWNTLSFAIFRSGYIQDNPYPFSNDNVEENSFGIPSGIVFSNKKEREDFESILSCKFDELKREVKNILSKERKLIINASLYLGKYGSMNEKTFMEFIEKYGNELNKDHMKKIKEKYSTDFYENKLLSLLKEED